MVMLTGLGAGCGSRDDRAARLSWAGRPVVLRSAAVPRDRVLRGFVRNAGGRPVELSAANLRLLDARGRPVRGVATFAAGYVHGLYPPSREPARLSEREQRRLGRRALLPPGRQVSLTVAWRQLPGRPPPVSVSYGRGTLPIPRSG